MSLSWAISMLVGLADGQLARLGALAERLAQHLVEVDHADLAARDVEGRELRTRVGHLDLDLLVVQLVGAQLLAEALARGGDAPGADQRVEHALLGGGLGLRPHLPALVSRTRPMPTSTRSRTMESTSRPT